MYVIVFDTFLFLRESNINLKTLQNRAYLERTDSKSVKIFQIFTYKNTEVNSKNLSHHLRIQTYYIK